MERRETFVIRAVTVAAVAMALTMSTAAWAQSSDLATRLSGTWRFNKEQSTQPGSVQSPAVGNDMMSNAQVAQLKQIAHAMGVAAVQLTIAATPEEVTITGGGSVEKLQTDGKKQDIQIGTATVPAKTKWDKNGLKQEVNIADTRLTRTWQLSPDGKQLFFASKLESASNQDPATPVTLVYDKQ